MNDLDSLPTGSIGEAEPIAGDSLVSPSMTIRPYQRTAAVFLLLFCLAGSDGPVAVNEQDVPVGRVIGFEPGMPIVDRLEDDDAIVMVLRSYVRPSIRFPPNSDYTYTEWKVEHADAIVVARITETQGVLTAEGDWVNTQATAVVDEAFKVTSPQVLTRGMAFRFTASGGVTTLDGKRIRARLAEIQPVIVGRRYLLLGDIGPNGLLSVRPDNIYEIRDGAVESSDRKDGDPLTWLGTPDDVFSEIKKYVASPRRKPDDGR